MTEVENYRQQRTCDNCKYSKYTGMAIIGEPGLQIICRLNKSEDVKYDHVCDAHEWKE